MINKIKDVEFITKLIIGLIGAIITCTLTIYITYNRFEQTHNDLYKLNNVATQMSLKAIIWSDDIPYSDVMSACDTYISLGYNSVTKKHCEEVLDKGGIYERTINQGNT